VESDFLHAFIVDAAGRAKLASIVRPEMIESDRLRETYQEALKLYIEKGKLNSSLLIVALKTSGKLAACGGTDTIRDLFVGACDPGAGEQYAEAVRDLAQRRAVQTESDLISKSIMAGQFSPAEAVERLMAVISGDGRQSSSVAIGDVLDRVLEKMENPCPEDQAPPNAKIGIPKIDGLMSLFIPSRVTVLAARASGGKSSFMRQVALNASDAGPVLIFSGEVSEEEIATVAAAQRAGVDCDAALEHRLGEDALLKFSDAAKELKPKQVRIYPRSDFSAMDVRLLINNEISRGRKPILVAIDYLGLMEHAKATRHDLEIAKTTRALKRISMECKVPILLLVQLNREVERRGDEDECSAPRLSDLRDSGAIEQDADNVIFLWVQNKCIEHDLVTPRILTVAKRRNGATFETVLLFDRPAGKFREATEHDLKLTKARIEELLQEKNSRV
jgi:replicative DNA helicase